MQRKRGINGMVGRVKYSKGNTIFIQNNSNNIIPVFPVYSEVQLLKSNTSL